MSEWAQNETSWGVPAVAAEDTWGDGDGATTQPAGAGNEWDTGNTGADNFDITPSVFENAGDDGERAGQSGGDGHGCFNCGKPGHMKAECPDPQVERVPEGPCRHCGEEGHWSRECTAPKKIDRSHLPDKPTEDAWAGILAAVEDRDIDNIKEAIQIYIKSSPETTYQDLEKAFRDQNVDLYLIAIERELASTLTNMDLQGHMEKKFTVTYRLQWNPPRPRDRELWPKDIDANIERLADAGEVTDRGKPKCMNCNEIGHIAKSCPQEKVEKENRNVIKCFNCDAEGHRVRDCPIPRVDKFACKSCGQSGHRVSDCTEPRSAADVECRKCGEMGHFSRDCPTAPNNGGICRNCGQEGHMAKDCSEPRKIQCRNCDEFGHMSKECPKPRDISRVKCSNCQEMGHYKSRCPNPMKQEDTEDDSGAGGFDNAAGGDGGFGTAAGDFGSGNASGGDNWGAAPISTEGAW